MQLTGDLTFMHMQLTGDLLFTPPCLDGVEWSGVEWIGVCVLLLRDYCI